MADWKPGPSSEVLKLRAELMQRTRAFFAARDVLEVETPLLGSATVTDVHIHSIPVSTRFGARRRDFYLQTSPEFAMKRLLCADVGAIYQICKAFREGEVSRRHNPEFTLLEWYRPGYSLHELMNEVEQLLQELLAVNDVARLSYRQAFQQHLDIDPHLCKGRALAEFARGKLNLTTADLSDTDYLQLLMSHYIEPRLPEYCLVYNYPQAQAALAEIATDENGQAVAQRFELYGGGMEIANGYYELTDAGEQRRRFTADLALRDKLALPAVAMDEKLLSALESGLAPCAGVALGFDRLVMLAAGCDDIRKVISFDSTS